MSFERMRLSKKSSEYITKYANKHNITYRNRVVNDIIESYADIDNQKAQEQRMVDKISQNISKQINTEISRIRLGTNNTDRNTQILIELLVGYMFNQNVKSILTTNDFDEDFPYSPYETAKKIVSERIKHQKQRKDDHASKKGYTD